MTICACLQRTTFSYKLHFGVKLHRQFKSNDNMENNYINMILRVFFIFVFAMSAQITGNFLRSFWPLRSENVLSIFAQLIYWNFLHLVLRYVYFLLYSVFSFSNSNLLLIGNLVHPRLKSFVPRKIPGNPTKSFSLRLVFGIQWGDWRSPLHVTQ